MVELILSPFKLPGARETLMPKPDDHNYNKTNSLYIYLIQKGVNPKNLNNITIRICISSEK